jgi:chitinase
MKYSIPLALFLIAVNASAQTAALANNIPKRLVADYGYWSRTQTPPYSSDQIPFQKLTHINHSGVSFDASGELSIPDGFLEPQLLQKAHAQGIPVLLLLGGDFPGLEASTAALPNLLANLKSFIKENGYDGLDIDWEYPSTTLDQQTFYALMSGLRNTFPRPKFILSADVPPWAPPQYDYPQVTPLVDYYNIMTYDCAGPWTDDGQLNSPIFPDPANPEPYECEPGGSVKEAIDILVGLNVPLAKLNMGTPFYGYFYKNVTALYGPCTHCGHSVLTENYGTWIKQRINAKGWQSYLDQAAAVPYLLRTDGDAGYVTYDDATSTFYRVWYSDWQRNVGGTFMWSLDADYDGTSQDLLEAMYQASQKPK